MNGDRETTRGEIIQECNSLRLAVTRLEEENAELRKSYLMLVDAVCRESTSPEDAANQARATREKVKRLEGELTLADGGWKSTVECESDTVTKLRAELDMARKIEWGVWDNGYFHGKYHSDLHLKTDCRSVAAVDIAELKLSSFPPFPQRTKYACTRII